LKRETVMKREECWHCKQVRLVYDGAEHPLPMLEGPMFFMFFWAGVGSVGAAVWSFTEGPMWGCIAVGLIGLMVVSVTKVATRHVERTNKLNADQSTALKVLSEGRER
jgi:hypothetical protein